MNLRRTEVFSAGYERKFSTTNIQQYDIYFGYIYIKISCQNFIYIMDILPYPWSCGMWRISKQNVTTVHTEHVHQDPLLYPYF